MPGAAQLGGITAGALRVAAGEIKADVGMPPAHRQGESAGEIAAADNAQPQPFAGAGRISMDAARLPRCVQCVTANHRMLR